MTVLGLVLLVVGSMVAIVEAHSPTHGVAGGLGVAAVALGAVLAISGLGAGILIALLSGALLASTGAGAVVWTVRKGVTARHRRVRTGAEGLIGQIGVVRSWDEAGGRVALDGALWGACRSLGPLDDDDEDEQQVQLHAGDRVVVERLNGLRLSVRPAENWELL
ncbi:MAG: NfeD family protein [Solirubrobacteraceae bacterium]